MHYWFYKFVQRVHNNTTSKKQLYRLVNTLLNLPQSCAEKLSFAVVQKRIDSEISLKLCALLALQVCAWPAHITTSKKQLYRLVNTLLNLPQICAEKLSFAVVQKRVETLIFHWNCVLLVLQVCAWPAQHHNKQKTTLQACKHLAKFVPNLCRKVWVLL